MGLGISWAYFRHISGISCAYLVHISCISWAYLWHIMGISWAYLRHVVQMCPRYARDMPKIIPDICHFFTRAKFLEEKIYTEKTRKLRQNTQKIANFLRYYGKIHSKLSIFRVKSIKIYTGPKKFTREFSWLS